MDIDPLADSVPPRYNVESDDEEDEVPTQSQAAAADTPVVVNVKGDVRTGKALVIASGDVGRFWARGAQLGEQVAAVFVGSVQVGMVFSPQWTSATVLVSEALNRLPLRTMHPYARSVLNAFKPRSLALIDAYPVTTYASDGSIPFHEAPVRYLCVGGDTALLEKGGARAFATPNLVQGTLAAFLAIASLPLSSSASPPAPTTSPASLNPSAPIQATLLLLPAPHIPPPAPRDIISMNTALLNPSADMDKLAWDLVMMADVQALAFEGLGETQVPAWALKEDAGRDAGRRDLGKRSEVGEGGMYI